MSIDEIKEAWAKLGTVKTPGSSVHVGKAYHEVPFEELNLPTHRHNLKMRTDLITTQMDSHGLKYKGGYGMDLGCSVGGLTFSLIQEGAKRVTGVDYDSQSMSVAKLINEHYKTDAQFINEQISVDTLPKLLERAVNPETGRLDFVMWFSHYMWLVKQFGLDPAVKMLRSISEVSDVMFFESSQGDCMAGGAMKKYNLTSGEAIKEMLEKHTPYKQIIDLGNIADGWSHRNVFLCFDPQEGTNVNINKYDELVERIKTGALAKGVTSAAYLTSTTVIKQFKPDFVDICAGPEANALIELQKTPDENISRHFPKLLFARDDLIEMENCGVHLSTENIPDDYEAQGKEILEGLKAHDLVHRDITPANLLFKDGLIYLIDFGWSTTFAKKDEVHPRAIGLGLRWKNPSGYDDTHSLSMTFKTILGTE